MHINFDTDAHDSLLKYNIVHLMSISIYARMYYVQHANCIVLLNKMNVNFNGL